MEPTPHLLKTITDEMEGLRRPPLGRRRLADTFRWLDSREARVVRVMVGHCGRRPRLRAFNGMLNLLGNGWLYLPLALFVPLAEGSGSWRFLASAAVSAAVAHAFYPLIKLRLSRLRPCDSDPTLGSGVDALDKYSCPSGHCMTAAAVGVPLALSFPATLPAAALVWLLIAWSRVSLGHHYPTDLLLGGAIGAGVSLTVARLLM